MKPLSLRSIQLGQPAAERDVGLSDYFVESDVYGAVETGKASILIGNRGSGKSAIFRILSERMTSQNHIVIDIMPDEYSYEILGSVLKKELDGSWAKQGSYNISWQFVLYIVAMRALSQYSSIKNDRQFKPIRKFLRDNIKGEQNNIIDHLVSYMKRFEGLKLAGYDFGGKATDLTRLYDLEEISPILPNLKSLLSKMKIFIIVDELDRGWDASEDARQFVAGLFQAAMQVNKLTPNLRVLISLRRELYDNIPEIYDDVQKVRDLVRYVTWDEDGLKDLIAKRIASATKVRNNLEVDTLWNMIFEDTLEYRKTKSFNYIVDRTLYRPREIIQFCNDCLEKTDSNSDRIGYRVIASAEHGYSRDRLQDIASEYRFRFPGLRQVFETFRGMVYSMQTQDLQVHCLEILTGGKKCPEAESWLSNIDQNEFIKILWEVGFLRGLAVGGQKAVARSGSRYLGPHQVGQLHFDSIPQYHIHPMFRSYLGLKEK